MTLARDVSNYTVDPLPLADWLAAGTGLVIIQCFPPSYKQYAQQVRQMQQCAAAGIPFDGYIYDYLAAPGWRDGALDGIRSLATQGLVCRRLWADEEDVSVKYGKDYTARLIAATLAAMDKAPTRIGLSGIYTGAWWWTAKSYAGNTQAFSDRPLWDSDYDGVVDTTKSWSPYGGWTYRTIKQYAGTQSDGTDLDVLSVDEAASLNPTPPEEPMSIKLGQGLADQLSGNGDSPLFGHKFYSEVDDDQQTYSVEEVYGTKGRYVSSNSSGAWVNAGPL